MTDPETETEVDFTKYLDMPTSRGREAVTVSMSSFQENSLPSSSEKGRTNAPSPMVVTNDEMAIRRVPQNGYQRINRVPIMVRMYHYRRNKTDCQVRIAPLGGDGPVTPL